MSIAAITTAASGLGMIEKAIEVSSNNIANSPVHGFKASVAEFSDLYYNNIRRSGIQATQDTLPSPIGIQIGTGVKMDGTSRLLTQGALENTKRNLDVAIAGRGYIVFALPIAGNGRAYSRNGSLKIDSESGVLTNVEGIPVEGNITIPDGVNIADILIDKKGDVYVVNPQDNSRSLLGTIPIYDFPNPEGLEAIGSNLLVESPSSGDGNLVTNNQYDIKAGYLEKSNVESIKELVKLTEYERTAQILTRIFTVTKEIGDNLNKI